MTEPIVSHSRYTYAQTLQRLTKAIADAGITLFAALDQSAAAKTVGLTLRPTTLLIFGNPKGGTPLMDAYPLTVLDLPLKIAVWEESGVVNLAYISMKAVAERHGITGSDNLLGALDRTLETITAAVTL